MGYLVPVDNRIMNNHISGLLIFICLIIFLLPVESFAKSALESVSISEGINQARPQQTSNTLGRRYVWNFNNQNYTILMSLNIERYNTYTSRERNDFSAMVNEGTDALQDLINEFRRVMPSSFGSTEKVNFVLAFVQSLPYTNDDVTTGYDEFPRYAVETLVEGGGDCEDTTILAASIFNGLGFDVALIRLPGHIALGIKGSFSGTFYEYGADCYYYCETTGTGWQVGDLPPSYTSAKAALTLIEGGESNPQPTVVKPDGEKPKKINSKTIKVKPHHILVQNSGSQDGPSGVLIFIVIAFLVLMGVVALYLFIRTLRGGHRTETDVFKQSKRSSQSSDPLNKI